MPRLFAWTARWMPAAAFAGLLATAAYAGPEDPRIDLEGLLVEDDRVLLTYELENTFDEALKRRIDSGLPTGFTFEFALARPRRGWFDNTVEKSRLRVEAMYNALTREYLINFRRDGNLIESRVVRDTDELRRAMTHFDKLEVFSIADRPDRQRLLVRLRASDLGTRTVFFFIPRTVNTDWVASPRFRK